MLAVARREQIKELIQEQKSVTVAALSQRFDVTDETIRKDLQVLEDENILVRTYGGAYIVHGVQTDLDVDVRESLYVGEKEFLGRKCAELVKPGECIFLDASTTSLHIAANVVNMKVTVITNSLKIAGYIAKSQTAKLVMIGGILDAASQSFLGRSANQLLERYYADKAFLSCRSVSLENGVTDSNELQAELRSIAVRRCNSAHLVVDHTKIGKTSFSSICGLNELDALLTDATLDAQWKDTLAESNVTVYDNIKGGY